VLVLSDYVHTQVPVPSGYDLILCRDALQHLPLLSVVDALENFARSDARYLLVRARAPAPRAGRRAPAAGLRTAGSRNHSARLAVRCAAPRAHK
jgi:hypothetical protein